MSYPTLSVLTIISHILPCLYRLLHVTGEVHIKSIIHLDLYNTGTPGQVKYLYNKNVSHTPRCSLLNVMYRWIFSILSHAFHYIFTCSLVKEKALYNSLCLKLYLVLGKCHGGNLGHNAKYLLITFKIFRLLVQLALLFVNLLILVSQYFRPDQDIDHRCFLTAPNE